MVVRVKLRLKYQNREVQTSAKVNSAFESEDPEIILPIKLAEKLGIWPNLPEGTELGSYGTAGGWEAPAYRTPKVLEAVVIEKDRSSRVVMLRAAIMRGEREVILSDKASDEFGIELVKAGAGLWRFSGETITRKSQKPKFW